MKGMPLSLPFSPKHWEDTATKLMYGIRVDEEEIESQTVALRGKLMTGSPESGKNAGRSQLKPHQVHELAAAKIEESEKLRKALGIREDYEEGSHWKKQEERLRDGLDPDRAR